MRTALDIKIDRIESDISYFSQELGPRPHGSPSARLAALYIRDQLIDAGWTPQFVHLQENIVACKGTGKKLFLAHSDSVPTSPGVIDNAVGVSILLELARNITEGDICLGFPAAEELGLIGAQHLSGLISKWHPQPDALELVIALDLTGYGELSITGLGPNWGSPQLQWLYSHAQPDSPYAYQAVSKAFPHMERSDHAPFANKGILSAQLLGRGPSGIFPEYHQAQDQFYSPTAIQETAQTLFALFDASESIPPPASKYDSAMVLGSTVLPGWSVWLSILLGLLSGLSQYKSAKALLPLLLQGGIATILASIPMLLLTQFHLFEASPAELTAAAVMGIGPTGWWLGSTWVSLAGAIAWVAWRQKCKIQAPSALMAALYTLIALTLSPLFALPFALSAILARLSPIAALLPAAYWLQPSILRELSFHGLVPPAFWGVFWLLALPAMSFKNRGSSDA